MTIARNQYVEVNWECQINHDLLNLKEEGVLTFNIRRPIIECFGVYRWSCKLVRCENYGEYFLKNMQFSRIICRNNRKFLRNLKLNVSAFAERMSSSNICKWDGTIRETRWYNDPQILNSYDDFVSPNL